jgi:hypothetical protein
MRWDERRVRPAKPVHLLAMRKLRKQRSSAEDLYKKILHKSSFGAKAYGPLAHQEAFAPETTTDGITTDTEGNKKCQI